MLTYLPYLVFVGAAIQLTGVLVYIRDTLAGKTKPNRVTWLLWSVAPLIGTAAAIQAEVGMSILPVFMAGFGPFLVFLASFVNKQAYWKLTLLDYFCGAISILALIFWAITKEPIIAIMFAIIADTLAAIPTLLKSWHFPETENKTVFITGLLSNATSFAAITDWNTVSLAFPIYLCVLNIVLITLLSRTFLNKFNL